MRDRRAIGERADARYFFVTMSASMDAVRIGREMKTSQLGSLTAPESMDSATRVSAALACLSETDLLRLQALARLRARSLPRGAGWSDLLHEAFVRALDGSRQWPHGLPLAAFLSGVMRSLCDEVWRRRGREAQLIFGEEDSGAEYPQIASTEPDQERVFAACEAIAAIHHLFAGDAIALRIIAGLESGRSAEEIRATYDLSSVEYDSARRRMRRALLRAGLSWSPA
jgi:DNA-directed RNA polymerase specialized sigma24 family protein